MDDRPELQMGTLANEAAFPGFRKGRVPRAIIEKRFGENVRNETRGQLVSDAFQNAIKSNELDMIGEPDFGDPESVPMVEPGTDLGFKIGRAHV